MSILTKILREKRKEVEHLRTSQMNFSNKRNLKTNTFSELVLTDTHMSCIAEIKRASPSKGMIHEHVDPVKQALTYEANGARAISVLTDYSFFKGSFTDLQAVSRAVSIPVLCKDFIIDRVQIDQAVAHGASMILLIVAALDDEQLSDLYAYATERNIEVLCEVHNVQEYERARTIGFQIIGVNNRDLHTFNVDLSITKTIADLDQGRTAVFVSESGIQTRDDVRFVQQSGARAILVGETLMRSSNLPETFAQLRINHSE